jgi:hypothetical protein
MFLEFLILIPYYKFQSKHCAGRSESNTQESYVGILDFEKNLNFDFIVALNNKGYRVFPGGYTSTPLWVFVAWSRVN